MTLAVPGRGALTSCQNRVTAAVTGRSGLSPRTITRVIKMQAANHITKVTMLIGASSFHPINPEITITTRPMR